MKQFVYSRCLAPVTFFVLLAISGCSPHEATRVHTIEIRQMKFDPAELTIHPGDQVVFVNRDIVLHDVTEQLSRKWSSGPLKTNDSWKLESTGSVDYYCSLHQVMKGRILVVK